MRKLVQGVGTFFVAVGAAVSALGVVVLGWSLLARTEPPPSLNEGHGLGFVFGIVTAFGGFAVFALGKSLAAGGRPQ